MSSIIWTNHWSPFQCLGLLHCNPMQSQMMLCAFKGTTRIWVNKTCQHLSTRKIPKPWTSFNGTHTFGTNCTAAVAELVKSKRICCFNLKGKHRCQRSMLGEKTAISTGTHIKRRRPLSWSDSSRTDGQCQPDKNQEPSSWIFLCMLHPGPVELHTHLHMHAHARRHTQRTLLRTNSLLNRATSH